MASARAAAADDAVEVLNRGPIHEAYAQPNAAGQSGGMAIPKPPPQPIEEVPPDVKPEGNAVWIGGYWSWDDDRQDFIWVSGVWRVCPTGFSWVPGYWTPDANGFRWVSGFWSPATRETVQYLPDPPQSLDEGPSSAAPSENFFWIPGSWQWQVSRYVWRPGYWTAVQPDFMWVPAAYYWTPRGYVYCDGYWDYPLARRGLMFAPVYYREPVYAYAGYYYSPAVVVDPGILTVHLFARPAYGHYYFGDYYAPYYENWGFCPWFAVSFRHGYYYDPLFVYHRWYFRDQPHWAEGLRSWHAYYREHENLRPPRTFAAAEQLRINLAARGEVGVHLSLAVHVDQFRRDPRAAVRLTSISAAERREFHESARQVGRAAAERVQMEHHGGPAGPGRMPEQQRLPMAHLAAGPAAAGSRPGQALAPGARAPYGSVPTQGRAPASRTPPRPKPGTSEKDKDKDHWPR
jgi:hypothetical protein